VIAARHAAAGRASLLHIMKRCCTPARWARHGSAGWDTGLVCSGFR